jgi:hypothetical protein
MAIEQMVGFGGKQAWLAVKSESPADVIAALGLRDLGTVPWRDGIDLAHLTDDRVAVTPPISARPDDQARSAVASSIDGRPDDQAGAPAVGDRWVLATGRYLLRPDRPVDVIGLSAALHTEVQYFSTHRVTESHRWQRAADGELIRTFGYVGQTGEVTSWHGEPSTVELEAGLPAELDEESTVLIGEKDVFRVAAAGPLHLGAAD